MTTSSTRINEWPASPSNNSQDVDWVMVNEDGHLTNDGFELIDAAEARCWCGGPDAERCRRQGHSWPLCDVDQGELWPESSDEGLCQSQQEEDKTGRPELATSQSAGEQSDIAGSKEAKRKPKGQSEIDQPGFYESGPFTKLAVLTEILDKGRYTGA